MEHPLRRYRRDAGLTLEALSARLGISKASLSRVETGRQTPSLALLQRITAATDGAVTANDFYRQDAA